MSEDDRKSSEQKHCAMNTFLTCFLSIRPFSKNRGKGREHWKYTAGYIGLNQSERMRGRANPGNAVTECT